MRRIAVPARTGVNPNSFTVILGKTGEGEIVHLDETVQQFAGGIDFHGKASLGEIHLHLMRSLPKASPQFVFVFAETDSR